MDPVFTVVFIVFVAIIVVSLVITLVRNNKIRKNGIEAEAVISRIEESESVDSDGSVDTTYTYYVTYRTMDGETVEAKLGKIMQKRYHMGQTLNIMYLAEKPNYVVPVK